MSHEIQNLAPNVTESPDGYLVYTSTQGIVHFAGGDFSNCSLPECPVQLSVYGYRASLPLSAVLIALYGLCIAFQCYLGWRYKTWSFMVAMLLGCFVEILGYIGRIMIRENPWNRTGFIMQIGKNLNPSTLLTAKVGLVLITIGPVFFAAAIYVMIYKM